MSERFDGNFTQQEPLSAEAIDAAVRVMQSGRLHRYNVSPDEIGEVGELELEFARYVGSRYCLAVASGGYAMATALRALGINKCFYACPCSRRNCRGWGGPSVCGCD